MSAVSYDDLTGNIGDTLDELKPFEFLKKPTEDDKLKWANTARMRGKIGSRERANRQMTNVAFYKGIMWEEQDQFADFRDGTNGRLVADTRKIVIPDAYRYVDALVGKLCRFFPNTMPVPATNEYSDKRGVKVAKMALESHDASFDKRKFRRRLVRRMMIFGEAFPWIEWDETKGEISKRWLAANKKYGKKRMYLSKQDWEYDPDCPERIGDVGLSLPLNWELGFDEQVEAADVRWVTREYPVHVDQLKYDYPEHKTWLDKAAPDDKLVHLDLDSLICEELNSHKRVCEIFIRSSKNLRNGYWIKWVDGKILEEGDNPLSGLDVLQASEFGDLPIEQVKAIEVDGQFHGYSPLQMVMSLFTTRNKIVTMANRNLMLAGHPKFLVHRNAKVNFASLGNDATMVEWSGLNAPQLVNFSTIPKELFAFYEMIGGELNEILKRHAISSGAPPPGIKAGVALRLLEEIEDQLLTNEIHAVEEISVAIDRKRLALMGKYYEKDDGRMIKIVGEDNQDLIQDLDIGLLSRPYNMRLEPVSQMARSPAARTQQIIDIIAELKNPATQEQVLDAMDLIRPEKIIDPAQAAVTAAEYVNELCAQDKELPAPRLGEHYLVLWRVHMGFYQRQGFTDLPERAQERFVDRMLALEFLMSEQALKNPSFAQELLGVPQWPAFYALPPEQLAPPMPDSAMGPGQTRPGGGPAGAVAAATSPAEAALTVPERLPPEAIMQGA